VTTDVTKLCRFDREDGSFNSISPSASYVAHDHVASVMAAIDGLLRLPWTRRLHAVGCI